MIWLELFVKAYLKVLLQQDSPAISPQGLGIQLGNDLKTI